MQQVAICVGSEEMVAGMFGAGLRSVDGAQVPAEGELAVYAVGDVAGWGTLLVRLDGGGRAAFRGDGMATDIEASEAESLGMAEVLMRADAVRAVMRENEDAVRSALAPMPARAAMAREAVRAEVWTAGSMETGMSDAEIEAMDPERWDGLA